MSHRTLVLGASAMLGMLLTWASVQSGTRGTQYAILISVSKYAKTDQWRTLKYTIDEMDEFRTVLTKTGFAAENIVFLHDRQTDEKLRPTGANIFKKLDLLLQEIGPDDTLLVAFNGHGVQFGGDLTGYFAPVNADLNDKKTFVAMDGKDGLYGRLDQCKARKKLLIVNACRNDPTVDFAFAAKKYDLVDKEDRDPPKGTAALFSCKPGQKSYEYPTDQNRKRSFFYHHLIEAWQGKYADGDKVTLDHVFDQVVRKTAANARNLFSEPQTPWPRRKYEGEWTLAKAAPVRPDPDLKGNDDKKAAPRYTRLEEIVPFIPAIAPDRQPDVVYVPSPDDVVAKMLEVAKVKKEDVVYDLGCGDGRIVVEAAKKYGCFAFGADIQLRRVQDANALVEKEKVSHLVAIRHADVFELDISKANVVTLYLLPQLNVKLIPQLKKLRPGSRIVSHDFNIEGVIPDQEVTIRPQFGDGSEHRIYLFVTPLKMEKKGEGKLNPAANKNAVAELKIVQGRASYSGDLTDKDDKDRVRTMSYCKVLTFRMVKGRTYQIDMKSKDIDAYLRLEDPSSVQVAFDDDGGGFLDARIVYQAEETGDFRIFTTTFGGYMTGRFTLTVEEK